MIWIPATLAAAALQVARNAVQRGVMGAAGPWGATLVRFLFGLPFALLFAAVAFAWAGGQARPHLSPGYLGFALAGAGAQLLATAALLVSMRRAGFGVGTAVQQSAIPLSALLGWLAFGDPLSARAWAGVAVTTTGLLVLTWPRRAAEEGAPQPVSGALYGLVSGLLFGFALNAYRHAAVALEPTHPVFSAAATVSLTQAAQSLALGGVLAVRRPAALQAVLRDWRVSIRAGVFGAAASALWLYALALAPAASVRAVGVIEAPIAAATGRRLFGERLGLAGLLACVATAAGVVMTALG